MVHVKITNYFFRSFNFRMEIRVNSYNNFRGYDARPLRGFIMGTNRGGIADEMAAIGKKEGFKIYSVISDRLCAKPPKTEGVFNMWAQDRWTILKNKLFYFLPGKPTEAIKNYFGLKYDLTQKVTRDIEYEKLSNKEGNLVIYDDRLKRFCLDFEKIELPAKTHIPGGNMYFIKGDVEGEEEVIIGKDELGKYSLKDIQEMFGAKKITVLPQMDYHVDLFIRPLDNKRILLADDNMTMEVLEKALAKIKENATILKPLQYIRYKQISLNLENIIMNFSWASYRNTLPKTDEIEQILKNSGYEVIRVPGRLYEVKDMYRNGSEDSLQHSCNFINANVFKNNEGDLVYITNKSQLDSMMAMDKRTREELGISFEKTFTEAISKYVKPEHVYFLSGEDNYIPNSMLYETMGGIHCTCVEVPQ